MANGQDDNNPPPDSPYEDPYGGQDQNGGNQTMETSGPQVSSSPQRMLVLLLLAVGFIGFVLWLIFGGGDDEEVEEEPIKPFASSAPLNPPPIPTPPPEPPPPPLELPPPPTPPEIPDIQAEEPNDDGRLERIKSAMVIVNAAPPPAGANADKAKANAALGGNDPNLAFAQNVMTVSEAEKAQATVIGSLNATIGQGKLIHAVLETAINTDLPGMLRAIVTRDVYAESGKVALIPKGSRLIGTYNSGVLFGQKRVYIIWTRVIRPDGIDVAIASPGIDQIGRAGMAGQVDNRYLEIFSGAALTSAITIAAGVAADSVTDGEVTTNISDSGSVTQTGSPGAFAALEASRNLSSAGKEVLSRIINTRPTITVDQGSRVNVFVNRDLQFPPAIAQRMNVIP